VPFEGTAVALTLILVVYFVAIALWGGGLVVLGAVVAPTVFGILPAPSSADAMTVVFRRFDTIAITCAAVALVSETVLAWIGRPQRLDAVRAIATVVGAALTITSGAYLSPAIHALHRRGAIRGLGDAGRELEHLHHLAERTAKLELVILLIVLVLLVARNIAQDTTSTKRL
jgi:hypothetical protein